MNLLFLFLLMLLDVNSTDISSAPVVLHNNALAMISSREIWLKEEGCPGLERVRFGIPAERVIIGEYPFTIGPKELDFGGTQEMPVPVVLRYGIGPILFIFDKYATIQIYLLCFDVCLIDNKQYKQF